MRLRGRAGRVAAAAAALLCLGTALVGVEHVGAQEGDQPSLYIRGVDASDSEATKVDFVYSGSAADAERALFTEDGVEVEASSLTPLPGTEPVNVALVFDTSEAAETSGTLVNAKAAAKDLIAGRTAEQEVSMRFAVFLASASGELIQSYTNSESRLIAAIDRVGPPSDEDARDKTALWSAIRQAGDTLDDQRGQANIVVMTAQNDNASGGDAGAARGAVASAAASVFAVAYTGTGMDPGALQALVGDNGGQLLTTDDGNEVGSDVEAVGSTILSGQFRLTFESTVDVGAVSTMAIQVGELSDTATAVVGGVTVGVPALHQQGSAGGSGVSALQSSLFLYLGILLILIAVSGAAYALFLVVSKDDSLARQLQPYSEYGVSSTDDDAEQESMATSALMRRAVDLTEQVATERGFLSRAENSLERANLPLRAAEFLFFYFAGVVVFTLLVLVLTRSIVPTLIIAVLAAMIPISVVNYIARRRKKQFLALLPDTLSLLSGTLRAGYSLMQGVEAVSQEVQEPMGQELRRVVTEARLGRPLEESLEGVADRMDSPDFAWAVMAIRIQREVGGNLSELLLTVAETMTARERLRRDVATLTAEGRVSAIVLGCLPIGLGLIMWTINPGYMGQLIDTTIGNILLGVAFIAMGIGFFWMKKIIDIEI